MPDIERESIDTVEVQQINGPHEVEKDGVDYLYSVDPLHKRLRRWSPGILLIVQIWPLKNFLTAPLQLL